MPCLKASRAFWLATVGNGKLDAMGLGVTQQNSAYPTISPEKLKLLKRDNKEVAKSSKKQSDFIKPRKKIN